MKNLKGMTLIEVLASVVVLSVGITACYKPLLVSLDVLQYLDERIHANYLMNEQIWKLEEKLMRGGELQEGGQSLSDSSDPNYETQIRTQHLADNKRLERVSIHVSWTHSRQTKGVTQEIYLVSPQKLDKFI